MPSRIALTSSTTYDEAMPLRIAFTSSMHDRVLRLLRPSTYDRAICIHALFSSLRIVLISSTKRNGTLFHALLASSLQQGMKPCVSSDHADPLSELFGFLPLSPVWVGRFFIEVIAWFSSPISRLGWEVIHQINQVRFTSNQSCQVILPISLYQPLVFLLSSPLG